LLCFPLVPAAATAWGAGGKKGWEPGIYQSIYLSILLSIHPLSCAAREGIVEVDKGTSFDFIDDELR
jgi:hypothetical protein